MVELTASDIGTVLYLSVYLVFLFILIIISYKPGQSCSKWIKLVWKKRAVYSPLIVQFYDQATDFGVLILWYQLMEQENNNKFEVSHINMTLFFVLSIVFIALYRFIVIGSACFSDNYRQQKCFPFIIFLSLFDFLFLYEVYFVHSNDIINELSEDMRNYQIYECIFESIPQIILQSVFILRTWLNRDEFGELYSNNEILLVASIIFSTINICNKYIWRDKHWTWIKDECTDTKFKFSKCKCACCKIKFCCYPKVNKFWFLHIFWRFCHVLARIILLVLLWTIVGGLGLSIYLLIIFISYGIVESMCDDDYDTCICRGGCIECSFKWLGTAIIFVTNHLVGMTDDQQITNKDLLIRMILRFFEYVFGIAAICLFIIYKDNDDFDCPKYVCSSVENRDFSGNIMIRVYVWLGVIAVSMDYFLFAIIGVLHLFDTFDIKRDPSIVDLDTRTTTSENKNDNEDHDRSRADVSGHGHDIADGIIYL